MRQLLIDRYLLYGLKPTFEYAPTAGALSAIAWINAIGDFRGLDPHSTSVALAKAISADDSFPTKEHLLSALAIALL